jgi:hypothetical protein
MIVLEGLLGARIGKPAATQIVVIGDEAKEVRSLDLDRGKLVLVVLGKGTGCSVPGNRFKYKPAKDEKILHFLTTVSSSFRHKHKYKLFLSYEHWYRQTKVKEYGYFSIFAKNI